MQKRITIKTEIEKVSYKMILEVISGNIASDIIKRNTGASAGTKALIETSLLLFGF